MRIKIRIRQIRQVRQVRRIHRIRVRIRRICILKIALLACSIHQTHQEIFLKSSIPEKLF